MQLSGTEARKRGLRTRNLQRIVVWTSTNRCNLNCRFCFGKESKAELGTENAKQLIEMARDGGAEQFVFSGGEPLLRSDIFELAAHARKLGMKVVLHTNGVLVSKENADGINAHFDTVNLPIDGADENTNAEMGRGSLRHTLEALELLAGKTEITISTVATRLNAVEVPRIAKLLEGRKIRKWRIFQFNPKLGEAERNRELFLLGDEEFRKLTARNRNAEFIPNKGKFEESYTLLSSDGTTQSL